jgi:DNA primase large subunit
MISSREDFAKYPFTKEAANYVQKLDLNVEMLTNPEYIRVVDTAKKRVQEALINRTVSAEVKADETEFTILSFPIAVLFVSAINNDFLKRRFALVEARRAYEILKEEKDDDKIVKIAQTSFKWKARVEKHIFFLNLATYLRNSAGTLARDDRWKLVNKTIEYGEVFLSKNEFARLLQEEVQKHIVKTIEGRGTIVLKDVLRGAVDEISETLTQLRKEMRNEELPGKAVSSAYPPCIKRLYELLLIGQHISHMGRFTLTSFLLTVGVEVNDLVKIFTDVSDFDQRQTRYQVEHIAGKKGSRTQYTPPKCSTLKTHGLCFHPDDICETITRPIDYYRKKIKHIKKILME